MKALTPIVNRVIMINSPVNVRSFFSFSML